jgi:hypothetical protein
MEKSEMHSQCKTQNMLNGQIVMQTRGSEVDTLWLRVNMNVLFRSNFLYDQIFRDLGEIKISFQTQQDLYVSSPLNVRNWLL